ncbi:UNVERIFIED_CONTAM: DNA-binding transcriptional LysR family regulator [Streptomyces canus]
MVTYAEDLPIIRRYWRTIFGKQHTAPAAVAVPNLYAVLSAVNAGAGYSVLPRSLCQDHLDSGRLTLLHDPEEPPLNTLFPSPAPRRRGKPRCPARTRAATRNGPRLVATDAVRSTRVLSRWIDTPIQLVCRKGLEQGGTPLLRS